MADNRPHKSLITRPEVTPSGPLGLCNPCCAARIADPEQPLRQAVTLVPSQVPIVGSGGQVLGVGVCALPHCWEHIPRGGGGPGRGLIIANGEVPRA